MPDTATAPSAETLTRSAYTTAPMCFPGVFTAGQCDAILAAAQPHMRYRSGLTVPREGMRTALTAWLEPGPGLEEITARLTRFVSQVNAYYRYEITGFHDPLLVSRYEAPGDHFEWHFDNAEINTSTRKLSVAVQLSAPDEYEGGALEFHPRGELPFARGRGSVIVFPAYMSHRVSPVTRGSRASLIWWAHGPAFR
jgi:PKHD-type hydroxylase